MARIGGIGMNDIEKAIIGMRGLKEILPPLLLKINYEGLGKEDALELSEHLDLAIQSLREKAGRDKGCEYCDDPDCPPLDWRYGLDHILPGYKHCPMCGRGLEEI